MRDPGGLKFPPHNVSIYIFTILRETKCLKDRFVKNGPRNNKREVGGVEIMCIVSNGSDLESKSEETMEWHRSIIVV